jgi:hypothetical protein
LRGFSAKAEGEGDCSPLAKAQWQYVNQDNMGAVAIREAVVIYGLTEADIKWWSYPESNPEYVLSLARLIFGSG